MLHLPHDWKKIHPLQMVGLTVILVAYFCPCAVIIFNGYKACDEEEERGGGWGLCVFVGREKAKELGKMTFTFQLPFLPFATKSPETVEMERINLRPLPKDEDGQVKGLHKEHACRRPAGDTDGSSCWAEAWIK